MRVAICVSGELRSIEKCWPQWQEKFLYNFDDYDIFYHTHKDDPDLSKLNVLVKTGKLKDVMIEPEPTLDEKKYNDKKRNEVIIQRMLRQLYTLKRSNDLKTQYERENNFKYDLVVRLRPDIHILSDKFSLDGLDLSKIYICDHDEWFGFNDRFYFSNSENMDIICNRIDKLDDYYNSGGVIHYETFLKYMILENDMEPVYIDMKTCLLRTSGELTGEMTK